jgi:hypothetical protein
MKQVQNQLALVSVAAIERSLTNACRLRNLMHTDIFNPSLGKQLPGHTQDALVKISSLTPFWPPAHPRFLLSYELFLLSPCFHDALLFSASLLTGGQLSFTLHFIY